MARPASRHPTELELEILKILWRDGPASGRQVRDTLAATRDLAYTSVMTILNIMARKGYLERSKAEGGYTHRARVSERTTGGQMVRDLVDRVFDGSAGALMLNLLETNELSADELRRLRELINRQTEE
jgi:BlaI family transcriptional regulator, penicillinase repressor